MAPEAPVKIILGTHTIGDKSKAPGITHFESESEVRSLLDAFRARGYKELDTAGNYSIDAPGTSELCLGAAGAGSDFIIHTKVKDGKPGDHEPAKIEASINKSLESLRTSAVETMFLHVPDRQTPFKDVAMAMNDACKQGKIKNFGISNYSPGEVEEYFRITEENGFLKPSIYQGHYNAIVRSAEERLIPFLRKHGASFFAYSPAAAGFFNPTTESKRWSGEHPASKAYTGLYGHDAIRSAAAAARQAAEKHGISGHAAAIRWTAYHSVLDGKYGDAIIFAVSKLEQLHKTLDAIDAGPLPDDLAEVMSAVYKAVGESKPQFHM